jgi:hypothetical protein
MFYNIATEFSGMNVHKYNVKTLSNIFITMLEKFMGVEVEDSFEVNDYLIVITFHSDKSMELLNDILKKYLDGYITPYYKGRENTEYPFRPYDDNRVMVKSSITSDFYDNEEDYDADIDGIEEVY